MSKDKIDSIFKVLALCKLSPKQEELVNSFEEQYKRKGSLSERQIEVLEDIYERASS